MTKSLSKVNAASLKVLYTLQLLFERDLEMNELIKYYELYHNEYNSNFVMSKYINTCRYCGIDIKKINNKYQIVNFPIGISFSENELSLFNELKNCCEKMKVQHLLENMQEILNKINRRAERPISPVSNAVIKDANIKTFEKACLLSQKVKITFKNNESIQCEPIEVSIKDDEMNLIVFDGTNSKSITPDNIEQVRILPQKSNNKFLPTTVLFEVKGKLAKNYQLRPHEEVMRILSNGDLLIKNRFEDKIQLFHRLMRYGDNCKLVSPKLYVAEMKEFIEETLKNYA